MSLSLGFVLLLTLYTALACRKGRRHEATH